MLKDMTDELRNALFGRSSMFIGSMETPAERILYHIIHETLANGKTVIWVCLKDPPERTLSKFTSYELPVEGLEERLWFVDATIIGDKTFAQRTLRCNSMDYICFTMQVGKLLEKHPGSLVMLDSIGMLGALEHTDVIIRLVKLLEAKIQAAGGGLVAFLANNPVPGSAEAKISGIMDTIIRVEEETIQAHAGSRELSISFSFSGNELIIGNANIENDLRELFSLSPEEKKKLELEVEDKTYLYSKIID